MSSKTKRSTANPDRKLVVDDPLLTKAEVAEMLGVTQRWVGRGYLPSVLVGGLRRYRRSAVLAYIEAQSAPAQNESR